MGWGMGGLPGPSIIEGPPPMHPGMNRAPLHLVWAQVWELLVGHYLVHSFLLCETQVASLALLLRPLGFFDSHSDLSTQSRTRLNESDVCINDGLDNLVVLEVR